MPDAKRDLAARFQYVTGWRQALLCIAAGTAMAMGQAPYSLFWLAFAGICAAFFLGYTTLDPRQAARRGMGIGLGFGVVTFNWIVEPFLVDIATFGWMAPFALVFMASGIGLFWAAAFWAARKLAPAGSGALALTLPLFWVLTEMVRSYALTGFPWGLTSYIWIDTPVYQLAAFVGPHGLTLATVLLASAIVVFLTSRSYLYVLAGFSVFAGAWIGGSALQNTPVAGDPATPRPIVRLIQPNASQRQKWDPEMMPVFFNRQLTLTAQVSDTPPDLVVWPEVAVPFLLNDTSAPFAEISDAANGAPVIIGAQRLDGFDAYNSLAVLGPGGSIEQTYDKAHLVPFGEYLPGSALLSRLGLRAMAAQFGNGFSAGPGPRVLDLGELGKVMPLICYEAIFPHELRRVAERPDWILIITNDAWFGEAAGPLQHFAQARARAVEMGLPVARAANTGVSAMIDARGNVVDSMPLNTSGSIDVALPPPLPATFYWRAGDLPVVVALFVLGLMSFGLKRIIAIDPRRAQM